MTQNYIRCEQVVAWEQEKEGKEGYAVKYPDGYISWSPKADFELAYHPQGHDPTRITEQMVDDFIVDFDVTTSHDKITIVIATLKSGFTIVESSACVDPANYDEAIGVKLCKERIKNQVWNQLGFILQWARGVL